MLNKTIILILLIGTLMQADETWKLEQKWLANVTIIIHDKGSVTLTTTAISGKRKGTGIYNLPETIDKKAKVEYQIIYKNGKNTKVPTYKRIFEKKKIELTITYDKESNLPIEFYIVTPQIAEYSWHTGYVVSGNERFNNLMLVDDLEEKQAEKDKKHDIANHKIKSGNQYVCLDKYKEGYTIKYFNGFIVIAGKKFAKSYSSSHNVDEYSSLPAEFNLLKGKFFYQGSTYTCRER